MSWPCAHRRARRPLWLLAAMAVLVVTACAPSPSSSSSPLPSPDGGGAATFAEGTPTSGDPGFVVVTSGGTALVDGSTDVYPDLRLRVTTGRADVTLGVTALLDGATLTLAPATVSPGQSTAVEASVAPMALGSAHALSVDVPGRGASAIHFRVVPAAGAAAAVHTDAVDGEVLDLAFSLAPDRASVERALPPGVGPLSWSDPTHARGPVAARTVPLRLPAALPVARGSHLVADLDVDLGSVAPGTVRRVVTPSALASTPPPVGPPTAAPLVVAFSVGTAASRASVAAHAAQLSAVSPDGLTVDGAGAILGAPDGAATAAALAAGVPVLPLLQNQGFSSSGVHALLTTPASQEALVASVRARAAAGGWAGIHLDLENVPSADAGALTTLCGALATGLHADGRRLAVAVVPHRAGHPNEVNAAYDLAGIGQAADAVTLMAYEQHVGSDPPGPVAGLDWDVQLLDGSLPELGAGPTTHALLGVPAYGRVWNAGSAIADGYGPLVSDALATHGAVVDFDFSARTPILRSGGAVTYLDDAASLSEKAALVPARGLAGIAIWRLGFEDPALWSVLPAHAARWPG